jgi:hypothetical protein
MRIIRFGKSGVKKGWRGIEAVLHRQSIRPAEAEELEQV